MIGVSLAASSHPPFQHHFIRWGRAAVTTAVYTTLTTRQEMCTCTSEALYAPCLVVVLTARHRAFLTFFAQLYLWRQPQRTPTIFSICLVLVHLLTTHHQPQGDKKTTHAPNIFLVKPLLPTQYPTLELLTVRVGIGTP